MAKNKIEIDVTTSDKGTTKKVAMDQKKAADAINRTGNAAAQTSEQYRRTQGAAQNSANSTKNFAKAARGIEGIVPIYATFAANVFAISAAFNILRRNAALEKLEESLNFIGVSAGQNLPRVANGLRELTDGAISAEQALRATSIAVSSGFSTNQLEKLTTVARGASTALGRDLGDALDRLVRGTAKLEPEILDELGIIVRLDQAANDYAATIGKAANELTQFEKQQAFLNATITQGLAKYESIVDAIDVNPYDKLASSADNLKKSFIETFGAPIASLVNTLADNTGALIGVFTLLGASLVKQVTPAFGELIAGQKTLADNLAEQASDKYTGTGLQVREAREALPEDIGTLGIKQIGGASDKTLKKLKETGKASINEIKSFETVLKGKVTSFEKEIAKLGKSRSQEAKARRAELKQYIKDIENAQERIKELRDLQGASLRGGADFINTDAAAGRAEALANTFEGIQSSGVFGSVGQAFSGIGAQFGNVGKQVGDLVGDIGEAEGRSKQFGLGLRALGSTGGAAIGALSNSFKILFSLGARLAGPIGIAISLFFTFEKQIKNFLLQFDTIKSVFESLGLATSELDAKNKEIIDSYSKIGEALIELDKKQLKLAESSETGLESVIANITVQAGIIGQFSAGIQDLIDAQKELNEQGRKDVNEYEKRQAKLAALDKVAESNTVVTVDQFGNRLELALGAAQLSFAQKFERTWLGILNFVDGKPAELDIKITKAEIEAQVDELKRQLLTAVSSDDVSDVARRTEDAIEGIVKSLGGDLSAEGALDTLVKRASDLETNLKRIPEAAKAISSSFSNVNAELNNILGQKEGPFTRYLEELRTLENNLGNLDFNKVIAGLKDESAKQDLRTALGGDTNVLALSIDQAKSFLPSLKKDIEGALAGFADPSTIKTLGDLVKQVEGLGNATEEVNNRVIERIGIEKQAAVAAKEASRLAALAPEFTKQKLDAQKASLSAQLQTLTVEKEGLLTAAGKLKAEENSARLKELNAQIDAKNSEIAFNDLRRQLDLEEARINVQKRRLDINNKILASELEIIDARAKIGQVALERQNRAGRNQDVFSGVGNRQARREKANEVALERELLAEKLNNVGRELKLKEEGIKLEYALLRSQTKFAIEQGARRGEDVNSLKEYLNLLGAAESRALQAANVASTASVDAQVARLESKEQELRELTDFLDNTVRGIAESFADGVKTGLVDLIRGRGSFKDALVNTANAVLDTIATNAVDELIQQALGEIKIPGFEELFKSEAEKTEEAIKNGGVAAAKEISEGENGLKKVGETVAKQLETAMESGGTSLAEKVRMACQGCGCPGDPAVSGPLQEVAVTAQRKDPNSLLEEVEVKAQRREPYVPPAYVPPDSLDSAGDQTMDLSGIATVPQVPGQEQGSPITDAVKDLTTKTEENSGFLTEGNVALADNIANTGLLIGSLFSNTKGGEKLQKVMTALKIATIALKIATEIAAAKEAGGGAGGFLSAIFGGGAANGGIAMGGIKAYAKGGIVKAPTLGLVGEGKYNEAIVPLPNGRAIPVDMKGSGNQENNIAVNIVMDGNGNVTSESQKQDAAREQAELGKRITQAIKAEIANQKRPGGQLSPYS